MTKEEIEKDIARVIRIFLKCRLHDEEPPEEIVEKMKHYIELLNLPEWKL